MILCLLDMSATLEILVNKQKLKFNELNKTNKHLTN